MNNRYRVVWPVIMAYLFTLAALAVTVFAPLVPVRALACAMAVGTALMLGVYIGSREGGGRRD
ncbi:MULTISPECIES: hypothetical protein [Actinotignum]|uniref:hypothetical protein n=1 Tax=Actinotignum TaxID=1653174 RepID=UPI00254C5ED3|nr:hypothetical protein [Actinotignum timonense]MDK8283139.1 hypothetical protein [Actinotignum timonense]